MAYQKEIIKTTHIHVLSKPAMIILLQILSQESKNTKTMSEDYIQNVDRINIEHRQSTSIIIEVQRVFQVELSQI